MCFTFLVSLVQISEHKDLTLSAAHKQQSHVMMGWNLWHMKVSLASHRLCHSSRKLTDRTSQQNYEAMNPGCLCSILLPSSFLYPHTENLPIILWLSPKLFKSLAPWAWSTNMAWELAEILNSWSHQNFLHFTQSPCLFKPKCHYFGFS